MKIICLNCKQAIRPLGLNSVSCGCTSFTVGIDKINTEPYSGWPVTMHDIKAILASRDAATA